MRLIRRAKPRAQILVRVFILQACLLSAGLSKSPPSFAQALKPQTLRSTQTAQSTQIAQSTPGAPALRPSISEPRANSLFIPKQILRTGVVLNADSVSPNSTQLADNISLTQLLREIAKLKAERVAEQTTGEGSNNVETRLNLYERTQQAMQIIQRCNLEIDFAIAQIEAEDQVYEEVRSTFSNDRDKTVARTNAAGFIANGALWTVCEALAIPGYKNSIYAIPSGIVGIPAGVVPSIASMWTLKQVNGKKKTSEVDPNMLAKLFGYPTNSEIEYPSSVWRFLHQSPADEPRSRSRLDQLIDRWVEDSNMSAFTDRNSKQQLDVLTASISQKKGLSISTLTARIVMLRQLRAEIWKMKRMLLELSMVVDGQKTL